MKTDVLYYGDNLDVLRRHVKDEAVDLVYLDPPFKSNQDYNVLFAEQDGSRSAAQIKAFEDTWRWDEAAAAAYDEVTTRGGRVADAMVAFRRFLGDSDMLAYLSMMAPRLIELHRVMKLTGSIYLHCDPTASHYLKMLMDAVFDPENFCNEIIWHYRKWPSGKYTFQRNHDVILFYSKTQSRKRVFHPELDPGDRAPSTLKRFGNKTIVSGHDEAGLRVPSQMSDKDSAGVRRDDVWDIGRVPPIKQLYPTQKPDALLERIIRFSTNEGDVVLDPFCGCGTAILAAQKLNRTWIGIDVTHLAIGLIKNRLTDTYRGAAQYKVVGEPTTVEDAAELAVEDPFQFQAWALGLVGARVAGSDKKGPDKGVDGRLYFNEGSGSTKQIIISVKAGKLKPDYIRALGGLLSTFDAQIGVLISFEAPTKSMRADAASAGLYESPWGKHPRIQLLTVGELLDGARIDYPPAEQVNVTYKKAQPETYKGDQLDLVAEGEPDEPYDKR